MSLEIIENSILKAKAMLDNKKLPQWPKDALEDFSLIDYDLIKNALI